MDVPCRAVGARARVRRGAVVLDRVGAGLLILAGLVLVAGGMLWWTASAGIDGVERTRRVDNRLVEAADQIRYLDEVLTHSSARFALTGDPRWQTRYDRAVTQLDSAIATSRRLGGHAATGPLDAVAQANQRLIVLEARIFRLGAAGRLAEAQQTMLGEYEVQNQIYHAGLVEFVDGQERASAASMSSQQHTLVINRWIAVGLVVVLLAAVTSLGRLHRRQAALLDAQSDQLTDAAMTDALTGLANRRAAVAMLDSLVRAAERGRPGTVMFIDLDGFKAVNDTFGHATGDDVLIEAARRLHIVVEGEGEVARLGGDEFLVLLDGDLEQASHVAQACLDAVGNPFPVRAATVRLSASIGLATAGADSAQSLLQDADFAAAWAKEHGKSQIQHFDASMRQLILDRHHAENNLRDALAAGQLEVYYQPILRIGNDARQEPRVIGAEALIRWRHPDGNLIPPDKFIPTAEASWLIVDIGRLVLDRACQQLAIWTGAGLDLHLSVNISGRHLVHADLVGDLHTVLTTHQVDPTRLTIEVTETHLLGDLDRASAVLTQVRALGIRVALDDFTTGYSTLTHLTTLPADIIKIDRSFVAAITHEREHLLVEFLQRLADLSGMQTIAEGVETAQQLALLAKLGCHTVQGFLFNPALHPDQFLDYANASQVDVFK